MKSIKNQNGSSLILVLLVSLVFVVLGLTILSVTIGGAKRTEIRGEDIKKIYKATNTMDEVISKFQHKLYDLNGYVREGNIYGYESELASFIDSLHPIKIKNISSNYHIDTNKFFTRALSIEVTAAGENGRERTVSRNLFLSPTPSFLQYTAGSGPNGLMVMNGGLEINGNVHVNDLILSNKPEFTDNGVERTATSVFPDINGDLFIRGTVNGSERLDISRLRSYFFEEARPPVIKRETKEFVEVNFNKTYAQKMNELQGVTLSSHPEDYNDLATISSTIEQLLNSCRDVILSATDVYPISRSNNCPSPLYLIEKDSNYLDINNLSNNRETIVYTDLVQNEDGSFEVNSPDETEYAPLYVKNDLVINNSWLVVHGDLEIVASSNNPIKIVGNILVTGNLIIRGDNSDINSEDDEVIFDSTMYVLGTSHIYSTNISGLDGDKQLVLLSKGDMVITRINEFRSISTDIQPLDAYFYTDSSAELYGVGSLFRINGGLFANEQLTINAIRQYNIANNGSLLHNILSPFSQRENGSRFVVTFDRDVILDQLDALPRVDELQIVLDDIKIE
ncbi:hypothetical protein ACLM5H_03015 [Fredinandcohnia humi]